MKDKEYLESEKTDIEVIEDQIEGPSYFNSKLKRTKKRLYIVNWLTEEKTDLLWNTKQREKALRERIKYKETARRLAYS